MKTRHAYFFIVAITLIISLNIGFAFAAEEASSIMCDNGTVNIGDTEAAVQDTCGEPNSQTMKCMGGFIISVRLNRFTP